MIPISKKLKSVRIRCSTDFSSELPGSREKKAKELITEPSFPDEKLYMSFKNYEIFTFHFILGRICSV